MSVLFDPSEVVEIAIEMEDMGNEFYKELARNAKEEEVKALFSKLADDELRHKEDFSKMLSSAEYLIVQESYPDEWIGYVRALLASRTVVGRDSLKAMAEEMKDPKEAIDVGITMEKDTILLYEVFRKFMSASGEEVVDRILSQEYTHLKDLYELKLSLSSR
jgi:rubrerythrin